MREKRRKEKKEKKEEEKEKEKQRYGIYICLDYEWNTSMEKVYGMVWNFSLELWYVYFGWVYVSFVLK